MVTLHSEPDLPLSRPSVHRETPDDPDRRSWGVRLSFGGRSAGQPVLPSRPSERETAVWVVVRASGDVTDERALSAFFQCAREAIRAAGFACRLIIDLRRVRQADSRLVAYLVEICRLTQPSRAEIELKPSIAVNNLLDVYRVRSLVRLREQASPR